MKLDKDFWGRAAAGFFALGLVLLPFDTLPYFRTVFREIGGMASFYPLSLGLLVCVSLWYFTEKAQFRMPLQEISLKLAGLFLVWVVISFAVNWQEISVALFKGRSGWSKGLLQIVMLGYCLAISAFAFWLGSRRKPGNGVITGAVLLSFAFPALFSILEILYLYEINSGGLLAYLRPFVSDNPVLYERLRSVSGEPTSFAFYCAFLSPWLIHRLIYCEGKKLLVYSLLFAYFIFLVVLTLSKAAYVMVLTGLVVFLFLAYFRSTNRRRVLFAAALSLSCFVLFNRIAPTVNVYSGAVVERPVWTVLFGLLDLNNPAGGMSMRVRLAAQAATFSVANTRPVFGVGFAQAGFHMHKYIPKWGGEWPAEVLNWSDNTPGTGWAPSHGLHARIAAETGYTGLLLWLGMWGTLGIALLRKTLKHSGQEALTGAILCVGVLSCVLMGFNTDSFKFFEYWIVLGLGWAYLYPVINTDI